MSIKTPSVLSSRLAVFLGSKTSRWDYANRILYNMCADEPKHDNKDIIVGKIWLIGRSYAAAVERRKNKNDIDADTFYYDYVSPKILSIRDDLDKNITELNEDNSVLTESQLDLVLQTHKLLTDAFKDVTGLEKRSLASKYMHFHCPNKFFIYDSIANQAIRKWVKLDKKRFSSHYSDKCDVEYAEFCMRILEFQEYCKSKHGRMLTPREIDNFLLSAD